MLPGNDHAEEFVALDKLPGLRRQVAPFPIDLPVVEHGAELVDGAVEEGLFFFSQSGRRDSQQFRPIGIAGEEIGVPPDVARLERLALGVGHHGHGATRESEDRLADEIAAEAHGDLLMIGARRRASPVPNVGSS